MEPQITKDYTITIDHVEAIMMKGVTDWLWQIYRHFYSELRHTTHSKWTKGVLQVFQISYPSSALLKLPRLIAVANGLLMPRSFIDNAALTSICQSVGSCVVMGHQTDGLRISSRFARPKEPAR